MINIAYQIINMNLASQVGLGGFIKRGLLVI